MSEIHYFVCDQCGHHEAVTYDSSSFGRFYHRPKNWTTIGNYEVCSIECAKNKADKLKDVPSETTHCKCRGCR